MQSRLSWLNYVYSTSAESLWKGRDNSRSYDFLPSMTFPFIFWFSVFFTSQFIFHTAVISSSEDYFWLYDCHFKISSTSTFDNRIYIYFYLGIEDAAQFAFSLLWKHLRLVSLHTPDTPEKPSYTGLRDPLAFRYGTCCLYSVRFYLTSSVCYR